LSILLRHEAAADLVAVLCLYIHSAKIGLHLGLVGRHTGWEASVAVSVEEGYGLVRGQTIRRPSAAMSRPRPNRVAVALETLAGYRLGIHLTVCLLAAAYAVQAAGGHQSCQANSQFQVCRRSGSAMASQGLGSLIVWSDHYQAFAVAPPFRRRHRVWLAALLMQVSVDCVG